MSAISYASPEDIADWAAEVMERAPDLSIGGEADPYLRRWFVVPRNPQRNVYLHEILRDDDDRALHDHPWDNQSLVLRGSYREITPEGTFIRKAGDLITRSADTLHRLELIDGAPCVSLFFTGPKVREWGFACSRGWVHWRYFTGGVNGELVGRGCGEA